MFVTWDANDAKGRKAAFATAANALSNAQQPERTIALDTFKNIAPSNVSVREGFDRSDWSYFRRNEYIPTAPKQIMAACMEAYSGIGVIRNVIDLMADFASEGVTIVHPNPQIEKFYKGWAARVRMTERTERILNTMYRVGNVVIKRQTARLKKKDVEELQRTQGAGALDVDTIDQPTTPKIEKNEIPWSYTILNPMTVEVVGEELAPFIGSESYSYGLTLPPQLIKKIKNPKNKGEQDLLNKIPTKIISAVRAGEKVIPLDPSKTAAVFYKKDDWQVWATPMLFSILKDLQMLEKMKLADLAALDGAVSHIRLWKLGNLEARILPTDVAIGKLAEMLLNNVGGGSMDLIWTPDIELEETSTDIAQFLGEAKYKPVLTAIHAGLGIPPTLTGSSTESGFTNNYISIKTLIERLEYGRNQLIAFWNEEISRVQKAMGFRFPAQLVFDRMTLSDESAILALLVQLADRDLISTQTIQERFGEIPELEQVRMRREQRKRGNKTMPTKAGPFHNAQPDLDMKKIFASSGAHTASEMGLDLDEKKPGEQTPLQHKNKNTKPKLAPGAQPASKPKGQPQQGRPNNSKDSTKRKQKAVKPRAAASLLQAMGWAESALNDISEIVHPMYLHAIGKKNLRSLTTEEAENLEQFKFAALANLQLYTDVDEDVLQDLVANPLPIPEPIQVLFRATIAKFVEQNGKEPTLEQTRTIQARVVALFHGDEADDDETGDSDDDSSQVL